MAMTTKRIQPKDVNGYPSLKDFAQVLCDQPNDNVEGILILCPKKEVPIFLDACTKSDFQGVDNEALGSRILEIIKFSDDLVISYDNFNPGGIKSIIYEFENLVFVVYNLREDALDDVYLVLVNTSDKDLGSFNANRGRVRAQMVVAVKNSGLLS
jgi:hypothetical protein